MIDTIDKLKCTGCKMCADVCAVNAITFDTDIQGFWYPKVNSSCVKCGACVKKCIVERPLKITPNRIGYAAYSKDDKIRRNSTSGGYIMNWLTRFYMRGIFSWKCIFRRFLFCVSHYFK